MCLFTNCLRTSQLLITAHVFATLFNKIKRIQTKTKKAHVSSENINSLEIEVAFKKAKMKCTTVHFLSTLSTDAASKLDVFGHDGHTLGMDGAQVGVLKQTNQVSLASLLESHHST